MKSSRLFALAFLGILVGLTSMWRVQDAEASIPLGVAVELGHVTPAYAADATNVAVRCPLDIAWNPDAGPSTGIISAGGGYNAVNVETESTTPIWFCWRSGTTKVNYQTVCRKRCVGCNNGSSYQAEVQRGNSTLFCLASSGTDGGVVVSVEAAK